MKQTIILLLTLVAFCAAAAAQNKVLYAAARTGMSIRQSPDAKAAVLEKIPYGEKVAAQLFADSAVSIITEGMAGSWVKVTWKGKTGYVVSSYLFPYPPPKAGTKTLKDYLKTLSAAAGPAVTRNSDEKMGDGEYKTILTKQLYKNGAELHTFYGYEYNSDIYFLPDMSIEQGFLLLRLLGEYAAVIGPAEQYPQSSGKKKLQYDDCAITVEKEPYGEPVKMTRKIRWEWQEGAVYIIELYLLDGQLVIMSSAGV